MLPMPRVVGFLTAGALMAVTLGAAGQPGAKPGAPTSATAPAKLGTARGVVKAVSATRLSLETGPPGKGAELVLVLDEKTVLLKRGKPVTVKDVRAGDPITVSYSEANGRAVAKRVWLRTPGSESANGPGNAQDAKKR